MCDPCNDVNLKEIIEKHTAGLEIDEARGVRSAIEDSANKLKIAGEIDFNGGQPGFTSIAQSVFPVTFFIVRSTYSRADKNEKDLTNKNNMIIGHNYGNVTQGDLRGASLMPIANPINIHNTEQNTKDKKKVSWLMQFWHLISENKLISGILIALVLAAIAYFFGIRLK